MDSNSVIGIAVEIAIVLYVIHIYIYMILKQNIYVDVLNLSTVYCIYIYMIIYIL